MTSMLSSKLTIDVRKSSDIKISIFFIFYNKTLISNIIILLENIFILKHKFILNI